MKRDVLTSKPRSTAATSKVALYMSTVSHATSRHEERAQPHGPTAQALDHRIQDSSAPCEVAVARSLERVGFWRAISPVPANVARRGKKRKTKMSRLPSHQKQKRGNKGKGQIRAQKRGEETPHQLGGKTSRHIRPSCLVTLTEISCWFEFGM